MNYLKAHVNTVKGYILGILLSCFLLGCYYKVDMKQVERKWIRDPKAVLEHIGHIRLILTEAGLHAENYRLVDHDQPGKRFAFAEGESGDFSYSKAAAEISTELGIVGQSMGNDPQEKKILKLSGGEVRLAFSYFEQLRYKGKGGVNDQMENEEELLRHLERAVRYLRLLTTMEGKTMKMGVSRFNQAALNVDVIILITGFLFFVLLMMVITDVNDRTKECNHLVEELSRSTAHLEELNTVLIIQNKALEQFAHMVSHDLRAPAANIIGLGNLLETTEPDLEEREVILSHIITSVNAFDVMLRDLMRVLQVK